MAPPPGNHGGRRRPEILAPAGSPECLPAAVAGGADAVFLGLRHFNARGRAENFRRAELPGHVAYLHRHGLKCYVVLNTLVHDDELPKALDLAAHAVHAGVDAAIVQDLGLWRVLRRELPALALHASTQMTVHDPAQIRVLAKLGAERVILARELTLAEVAACSAAAASLGIEVEHFVHGALCYAFSGQCLMSNFAGCRSANRGTCAQNCRFDYATKTGVADSEISLKDLNLLAQVGDLAAAGVASLKIEGRLKGPDYVYTVSRAYRAAADAWVAGGSANLASERDRLREVFARPPTAAPLLGVYDAASRISKQDPQDDRTPDAILLTLDRERATALVQADPPPRAGQGFTCTLPGENGAWTDGFLVLAVDPAGAGRWRLKLRIGARGPRIPSGTPLHRNRDQARQNEAAQAMATVPLDREQPGIPVQLTVTIQVGQPLEVSAHSADGRTACVTGTVAAAPASGQPLTAALIADKLGAFGGTGFACGAVTLDGEAGCFVPASELKNLRRTLVERLAAQPAAPVPVPAWQPAAPGTPRRRATAIWAAVGSIAAGRAAIAAGADAVWLDDPTLDLWGPAAPAIACDRSDKRWFLRHPATARVSPHLAAIGLGVVAGQIGVLAAAQAAGLPAIADHPCNAYSTATIAALGELGAGSVVISLECSAREIAHLAARLGDQATPAITAPTIAGPAIAIVAHGRVPAMLTRQDHGLAPGQVSRMQAVERDGGLPYELQRRIHGDTVIWEGRRLCAPAQVQRTAGLVDAWLLELGDLAPAAVGEVVAAYRGLAAGTASPEQVERLARQHAPGGFFAGHLDLGSRDLDAVAGKLDGDALVVAGG